MSFPSLIQEAIDAGVLEHRPNHKETLTAAANMHFALEETKGRSVLFLGAAISTFKPTQLPMWNEFVKLLWSSCVDVAFPHEGTTETFHDELTAFHDKAKNLTANYLVTEAIARRLGMDYLNVLEAFEAVEDEHGKCVVNHVHKWTAHCLITGMTAAVMTTNFDNYIEKALEMEGAVSYQVTGSNEIDDGEISGRLRSLNKDSRLVLIVNGAKAFAFVRSLMPQLGGGKITFLFKLHGSCYDPPTCIDTRLQRAQGLPSFCTDILDTLLKRAVWLVAGFSGSDMNDNLDYLRFLSNKDHARIFWASYSGIHQEKAIGELTKNLLFSSTRYTGLSHMLLWFTGNRVASNESFNHFQDKIAAWATNLGPEWCRLIVLDLTVLLQSKSSLPLGHDLIHQITSGEFLRQDWNPVLANMRLEAIKHQADTAKSCAALWSILSDCDFTVPSSETRIREYCDGITVHLQKLRALQYDFVSQEMQDRKEPLHAQAWVLSALSGLAMLVGGQPTAALRAFERSITMAQLVSDEETNKMVTEVLAKTFHELVSFKPAEVEASKTSQKKDALLAFSPAMDNVNAKMNMAGVPPQVYGRALLNRSLLFADCMAIMPSTISNSTVFVDEILFQGVINKPNLLYLEHIILLLPEIIRGKPKKITEYRNTRNEGFVFEAVNEAHIAMLDAYYDDERHASHIMYYDEPALSAAYGAHLRSHVHAHHRRNTTNHLVRHWRNKDRKLSAPAIVDSPSSSNITDVAQDFVKSFAYLLNLLKKNPTRSDLYRFADLFDEAVHDPHSFFTRILPDLTDTHRSELVSARERMTARPWLYGPLCHELFDIPYQANLVFWFQSYLKDKVHVFIENADVASWEYTAVTRNSPGHETVNMAVTKSRNDMQVSALLLSQLPKDTVVQARRNLSEVRSKIRTGDKLTDSDQDKIRDVMRMCKSGPVALPDVKVDKLVDLDEATKIAARELLAHCIFIVRRGHALDPMYEEAEVSIPGLLALSDVQQAPRETPVFHTPVF